MSEDEFQLLAHEWHARLGEAEETLGYVTGESDHDRDAIQSARAEINVALSEISFLLHMDHEKLRLLIAQYADEALVFRERAMRKKLDEESEKRSASAARYMKDASHKLRQATRAMEVAEDMSANCEARWKAWYEGMRDELMDQVRHEREIERGLMDARIAEGIEAGIAERRSIGIVARERRRPIRYAD